LNYAVPTAVLGALWGLTDVGAEKLLRHFIMEQASQEVVSREADELRLLHDILMAPMLSSSDKPSTVGGELRLPNEDRLANVGLRVLKHAMGAPVGLFVRPETVVQRLLQATSWKTKNIRSILLRIPGAVADQQRVGGVKVRGVLIPWQVLDIQSESPLGTPATSSADMWFRSATTVKSPLPGLAHAGARLPLSGTGA
jgi:hypothetical protein